MHRSENISEDSLAGETLLEDSDGGGGCAYHSRLLDYGYDMLVGENITRLFCFQGPCKWLPIEKSVTSIICGMILHGCGLGASLVGGFSDAHKSAVGPNFVIATLQVFLKSNQISDHGRVARHHRHLWHCVWSLDLCLCLGSICW